MTQVSGSVEIRELQADDWQKVCEIYAEGIKTGNATFETQIPTWESWNKGHLSTCRFVAISDAGDVLGWAALSPVSGRCVYAGVAEVSVYIGQASRGKGIGRLLLSQLVESSEKQGVWMLQAGIFPENQASIALHESYGFRRIGIRERLGQMADGRWRDVVLMERRSQVVGV